MYIREATVSDIAQIQVVRRSVKENLLTDPLSLTDADYNTFLTVRGKGWVIEKEEIILGFAIADLQLHNVWALFVLPHWEGKGIGKWLHDTMLYWYFSQTQITIWLSTGMHTRAEQFYRKQGWTERGVYGINELKFEMDFRAWLKRMA